MQGSKVRGLVRVTFGQELDFFLFSYDSVEPTDCISIYGKFEQGFPPPLFIDNHIYIESMKGTGESF